MILATSIISTEAVLRSMPLQRLKRNTLFVDVLSVKARGHRAVLHPPLPRVHQTFLHGGTRACLLRCLPRPLGLSQEFPKKLMLKVLPPHFDILCLHPMFGPDSGRGSWQNLPLVYDKARDCWGYLSCLLPVRWLPWPALHPLLLLLLLLRRRRLCLGLLGHCKADRILVQPSSVAFLVHPGPDRIREAADGSG